MHPVIQHIHKTHSGVTSLLSDSFGIPVDKLSVTIKDWDTQTTLDAVHGNTITSTLISNLNEQPAEIKRTKQCILEIQKNDSWLYPIVLLDLSTILWPSLKSRVPISKCPFDGDYFLLDGSHRCRALMDLFAEDSELWKCRIHKVAIARM